MPDNAALTSLESRSRSFAVALNHRMTRSWRPLLTWALVGGALAAWLAPGQSACADEADAKDKKLRVVVVGAHPDDPEIGVGGLIASLTAQGHEVLIAYLACYREGRQYFGQPEAQVRHAEAEAACKMLNAKPKFFPYSAGKTHPDATTVAQFAGWLDEVKPDIVLTHWPFDTHPDHHAASSIVWQCYQHEAGWTLYFYEVATGVQTIGFTPNLYLDITAVHDLKKTAAYCHKSQMPDQFWVYQAQMHNDRGKEAGVRSAEAFYLVEEKRGSALLPLRFLSKDQLQVSAR